MEVDSHVWCLDLSGVPALRGRDGRCWKKAPDVFISTTTAPLFRSSQNHTKHSKYLYSFTHTMADALKAEGNKLFAAKDFQGSMLVNTPALCYSFAHLANKSAVRSSPKLLSSTLPITFSTPIDPAHTLRLKISTTL